MKKYWNEQLKTITNVKELKRNELTNVCYNCKWFEREPEEQGCTHDSLYSENGYIIESKNNRIIKFQESGRCPLKTISKMFKK